MTLGFAPFGTIGAFSPPGNIWSSRFQAFSSDPHVARQRIFIASRSSAANHAMIHP
jgi:hypothetical protein